jgi:phosphohistidine phosphatase
MRLFLLRHGQADARETWEGPDAERPLTDEGRAEMHDAARGIERLQLGVEVICTSPLVRASQTAQIVAEVLGIPVTTCPELAPGCGLAQLKLVLTERSGMRGLLLVGHEPDLSTLIGCLIATPQPARVALRKGACCRIDLPAKLAGASGAHKLLGAGELQWLLTVRHLAGLAPPARSVARAGRKAPQAG